MLEVLQRKTPRRRPVWFMRQAGRYLPEYRRLRAQAGSFLDLCYDPKLAAEITLQPLKRFNLDAAIVFADILVVPHAMGVPVRFEEGEGPVLAPIGGDTDVAALRDIADSAEVARVCETIARVAEGLTDEVALIGFCGAPWTVASYMVEGGSSPERAKARLAACARAPWFCRLIARLTEASIVYLRAQAKAGAQVVQIFDSWAGDLPEPLLDEFVLTPIGRIRAGLRADYPDVPVIVFARGVGAAHGKVARATGAEGLSLEASVPLSWAARELAPVCAVQGNLDPLALLAPRPALLRAVDAVVGALPMDRHIFNLGHGVRPETDPESLATVIDQVRRHDEGRSG